MHLKYHNLFTLLSYRHSEHAAWRKNTHTHSLTQIQNIQRERVCVRIACSFIQIH